MGGKFIITLGDSSQLPQLLKGDFLHGHREPRIAMVGRSNVGKSSLINALLGTKLARVSNEPGKTRSIHFYLWQEAGRMIADLPGYGYARTSHEERDRWSRFINAYLTSDTKLERALMLLDSRHEPSELDEQAMRFLSFEAIPVTFVFTKSDTLKTQSERAARRKDASEALRRWGYDPTSAFWVSSKTKDGLRELIRAVSG